MALNNIITRLEEIKESNLLASKKRTELYRNILELSKIVINETMVNSYFSKVVSECLSNSNFSKFSLVVLEDEIDYISDAGDSFSIFYNDSKQVNYIKYQSNNNTSISLKKHSNVIDITEEDSKLQNTIVTKKRHYKLGEECSIRSISKSVTLIDDNKETNVKETYSYEESNKLVSKTISSSYKENGFTFMRENYSRILDDDEVSYTKSDIEIIKANNDKERIMNSQSTVKKLMLLI
ncbi:MAG: hypothetical protein IKF36_06665 [Bacilli bacterium]|nr:hypothetical protein [Bacilli bacterium]